MDKSEIEQELVQLRSTAAGLRRALEEINDAICVTRPSDIANGVLKAFQLINAAIAASPADHARRIKAEAYRESAKEIYERIQSIKPKAEHGFIAGLLDAKEILFRMADVEEHIARGGKVEATNGR